MTHINAYFADVEEAKAKVVMAQSDLELAEKRLEAKKLEDGFEEPAEESVESEETMETEEVSDLDAESEASAE